jgi:hypothetical protein
MSCCSMRSFDPNLHASVSVEIVWLEAHWVRYEGSSEASGNHFVRIWIRAPARFGAYPPDDTLLSLGAALE